MAITYKIQAAYTGTADKVKNMVPNNSQGTSTKIMTLLPT